MTSHADRDSKSPPISPPKKSATDSKHPPTRIIAHPLKSHPGLFYTLLAIFILWIAGLLTMYFTTVYHKTDVHIQGNTNRAEKQEQ